jgi:prepilin-type N-terminal cleavage/methylation domain-containing protein
MNRKGFTLIELMIVIAIIAIIAAIAIPGLLRAKISGNETSAIGSLKAINTSQSQFHSGANVDQDGDGTGEFGLLGELAGTIDLRGVAPARKVDPGFISKSLAPTGVDTYSTKSGYYFKIYLPGDAVLSDTGVTAATADTNDANSQEVKWRGYAWPASAKSSGNRAFAVDQAGEIFTCSNLNGTTAVWSGSALIPGCNAAVTATDDTYFSFQNMQSGTGVDGAQNWKPAN